MAENISDVTDTNFQAEVLENDTPVLVDFWAPVVRPVPPGRAGDGGDRQRA